MVYIGSRVRDFRQKVKVSQSEIAELVHMPQSKISQIEQDKEDTPLELVLYFAKYYRKNGGVALLTRWESKLQEIIYERLVN